MYLLVENKKTKDLDLLKRNGEYFEPFLNDNEIKFKIVILRYGNLYHLSKIPEITKLNQNIPHFDDFSFYELMLPDYKFTRIDDLVVNYCLMFFDKENWDVNYIDNKIYINVLENFYKNSNLIQESTKFLEIDQNNNVVLDVSKTINKRIFICLFYHMQEVINENLKDYEK